jgi:hypothetical protein
MKAKLVIVFMFAIVLIIISYLSFKDFSGNNDQPEKPQPKEAAQFETEKMKEELALTSIQADSIKAINLKFAQKIDDFEKQENNKEEGRHSLIKTLNKQKETDYARILSPEQLKKYQETRKIEKKQHLSEKLANSPLPEDLAKEETEQMKDEFSLSDKQVQSVYNINLKYAIKFNELIHNEISNKDDVDDHEQMRILEKQKTEEFTKVLTANQLKQYIEIQHAHHHFGPKPPKD